MRTWFVSFCAVAALTGALLGATGCDEIGARRKVQEANDQYKNGRYEEAAKLYEEALAKSPDLHVAQHNLGVAYYKLMGSAEDEAEIKAYADKATEQLSAYLAKSATPKEQILLRKLLTEIWINSGQVDKALAFWEAEHAARPEDLEVLDQLAGLNNKKQDWRKAIEWLHVWVATAKTPDAKAEAYQKIGNLCFLRMLSNRDTVVGAERIELSDIGTAALQQALELQPKNAQIVSTLGSMNQQRALAEGSQIGFQIDLANHKDYMRQFSVLNKAKAATPPAEAPAPSGDGS